MNSTERDEMRQALKLPGKFHFSDLGFQKKNIVVQINTPIQFEKFLYSHLMSQTIDFTYNVHTGKGTVWVGGIRQVGTFRREQ